MKLNYIKNIIIICFMLLISVSVYSLSSGEFKSNYKEAIKIINSIKRDNINNINELTKNKYLVSALYFSDKFLTETDELDLRVSSSFLLIKKIYDEINPEIRSKYLTYLNKFSEPVSETMYCPVPEIRHTVKKKINNGKERWIYNNHQDALDLFADENDRVVALTGGVILMAEKGWTENSKSSVTSVKGGNSVIVYNSSEKIFYRYCHMKNVHVKTGDFIKAGDVIGTVGITGDVAFRRGIHHLHLEMNYVDDDDKQKSFYFKEILKKVEASKPYPLKLDKITFLD